MTQNCFLKSEKIILKPIETEELSKLARMISTWVNDGIVTYYLFTGQKPQNSSEVLKDFTKLLEEKNNIIFLIIDQETKKMIGYAGIYEINPIVRKGEFRILIGEKNFWNKGYGTEITELVTYYGFDRLNLNRIYLGYASENKGAGRAYEKAGYQYEGTLKEDVYRNSQYYDGIKMAILREDYYKKFYKPHLKRFGRELIKK
ncbi:GNAT family N-acetyltransferase [Patescibacteria group bacterium]